MVFWWDGRVQLRYCVRCLKLPLAVYREVAAHLCQVEGVQTGLIWQQSSEFDYTLSQIDHLWIQQPDDANPVQREQVQRILAYYGDRYGAWEPVADPA